jgi:saccharopine dehydrogenase (NADP+, L-glutamate forming)
MMEEKLKAQEWERDLVYMQNEFKNLNSKGQMITRKYDLVVFGRHNNLPYSAVSLLVSMPCAITAQLMLDGKIKERGVLRPSSEIIINTVLDQVY